MKLREVERLRFQDQCENAKVLKIQKEEANMKIMDKHLALSLMNRDKRTFLTTSNDKHRAKQVMFQQSDVKTEYPHVSQPGESVYQAVERQFLNKAAYAPDLVKLTNRDIKRILGVKEEAAE